MYGVKDKAVVIFRRKMEEKIVDVDIEVPLDITVNEFITALNQAYELKIDMEDMSQCYLRCERPMVLLRGDRTLREFGVRDAMLIHFEN